MKIKKRIHPGYLEFEELKERKKYPGRKLFEKWQWILSSPKGEISLIQFALDMYDKPFEIYCMEGDLFEDVERFKTFREAKSKCMEYLKCE